MNAVTRLIETAKTAENADSGYRVLADFFHVTMQAIHNFESKGWLPVDRARAAADRFGVPLRDLVRADIRDAMDASTAATA